MYNESAICVQMPVLVKARQDGDRRLVEVEASNEAVDSEGDVILQQALLGSAGSFLKSGHLDIDHLSEIGDRMGIMNPSDYIVGNPVEVKDLGAGRTSVVGELHKNGRPKAEELWTSLKADPPVRWQASIYGFPLPGQMIDLRVTKAENTYGANRFIVQGLNWRSLAFTRSPINTSLKGNATVVSAKSMLAVMKSRMQFGGSSFLPNDAYSPLIASPKTDAEVRGHFYNHIAKGNCPCAANLMALSPAHLRQHFEKCCGDTPFEAAMKARVMLEIVKSDNRVTFYHFPNPSFNGSGKSRTILSPSSRQARTMNAEPTAQDMGLIARIYAAVKGQAHGGMPGSDKIEGIQMVPDMFTEPNGEHSNPTRSEIVTGPAERASGGGAAPMVARYSDFSAQSGLTQQYDRLGGIMREMGKAMEAIATHVGGQGKAIAALTSAVADLTKAKTEAETAAKAAPAADSFLGKVGTKLEKARKALRKADLGLDVDDRATRKAALVDGAEFLKSAAVFIKKADEEDEDEKEIDKARDTYRDLNVKVTKALAEITKAEDEEKEKEVAEKAKADVAAKAEAEAAEAAKKAESSEEDEKKDDTAKAAAAADLEKALKGLSMDVTTVKGFMEKIMNASRGGVAPPPTFAKAETADVVSLQARIDAAMDDGSLNDGEGIVARSLFQRQVLAKSGRISADQVARDIAAAPSAVRQLFQAAA